MKKEGGLKFLKDDYNSVVRDSLLDHNILEVPEKRRLDFLTSGLLCMILIEPPEGALVKNAGTSSVEQGS